MHSYTLLTTILEPSTFTTRTDRPFSISSPPVTTLYFLSSMRTIPEGRNVVIVTPSFPARSSYFSLVYEVYPSSLPNDFLKMSLLPTKVLGNALSPTQSTTGVPRRRQASITVPAVRP